MVIQSGWRSAILVRTCRLCRFLCIRWCWINNACISCHSWSAIDHNVTVWWSLDWHLGCFLRWRYIANFQTIPMNHKCLWASNQLNFVPGLSMTMYGPFQIDVNFFVVLGGLCSQTLLPTWNSSARPWRSCIDFRRECCNRRCSATMDWVAFICLWAACTNWG